MKKITREFYDPKSAAEVIGVSEDELWYLIETGKIDASINRVLVSIDNYDFYGLPSNDKMASVHTFEITNRDAALIAASVKSSVNQLSLRLKEPIETPLANARTGETDQVVSSDQPVYLNNEIEITRDQIVIAQFAIDAYKAKNQNKAELQTEISANERNSMLKIIAGLARSGYKFPKRGSKAEIHNDLQFLGISLDEKTLSKYLDQAEQYLPQKLEGS
jgi:hypothetical protein